jgi:hypothetical protein
MSNHSALNVNHRGVGGNSGSAEPTVYFRVTCTACEESKIVTGGRSGEGADRYMAAHRKTHGAYASMCFFRKEILTTDHRPTLRGPSK